MDKQEKDMPLISVIVPVYNAENYIGRCMDSLFGQSYQNVEIVLVDDGSTDASGSICDEYAENYDRVIAIHRKNGGVGAARNTGMSAASGEYIHFCDADDWIEPETYSEIIPRLLSENADIALFGWYADIPGKDPVSKADHALDGVGSQFDIFHSILIICGNYGGMKGYGNFACNKIYRKESLLDHNHNLILFDENVKVAEDGIWLVNAGQNWKKGVFVKKPYYHYFQNNKSIMNTPENFSRTRLESQRSHIKMLDILKDFNQEYYQIHKQACIRYFWIVAKTNLQEGPEFLGQIISNIIQINEGICPRNISKEIVSALRNSAAYKEMKESIPVESESKFTNMIKKLKEIL